MIPFDIVELIQFVSQGFEKFRIHQSFFKVGLFVGDVVADGGIAFRTCDRRIQRDKIVIEVRADITVAIASPKLLPGAQAFAFLLHLLLFTPDAGIDGVIEFLGDGDETRLPRIVRVTQGIETLRRFGG